MKKNNLATKVLIEAKTKAEVLAELDLRLRQEMGVLLKSAVPSRDRIHQLAKLMHRELGYSTFDKVRTKVLEYYRVPFERRTAGQFVRCFGMKPYPWLHSQFLLNFCTAHITDSDLSKLAGRLRHHFKMILVPPRDLVATNFLHLVLHKLSNPRPELAGESFGLHEFVEVWRKLSFAKWGNEYEGFFNELLENFLFEASGRDGDLPLPRGSVEDEFDGHDIELSQTDIDWLKDIVERVSLGEAPPFYPLSRGPKPKGLRQIERIVRTMETMPRGARWRLLGIVARNICNSHLKIYDQAAFFEY